MWGTVIVELSEYVLEPLRKDEEFILYRGQHRNHVDAPSVLLLTPVSTRPAPESLERMEHEYSLRAELDLSWAVRPLARLLRAQHPVQPYGQLARRCHFRHRFRLLMTAMPILFAKLRIQTDRTLRRFYQQHAQHAIALLGDRSQLLPSAGRMLARNQTQIAGHLLAAREAAHLAHGQHIG